MEILIAWLEMMFVSTVGVLLLDLFIAFMIRATEKR